MSPSGPGSTAWLPSFALVLVSACGSGGSTPAESRDSGASATGSTTGSVTGASSGVSPASSGGGQQGLSGATGSDALDSATSGGFDAADSATAGVYDAADSAEAAVPTNPGVWRTLTPQPSPVDNPLKGFMPYRGTYAFPHSMEWFYVPLKELMSAPSTFTFATGLEPLLSDVASRGHQAVFRVYLDYPSLPTGVPQFLIDGGLVMRAYTDYGGGQSPDYENPNLVAALEAFVAAFGAKYDADPRIGFITEGLLGFWGEWHTYPHDSWFASVGTQNDVLHGFASAFTKTKLLVRKPTADSPTLPVGYHDDSFAYETLPPTASNFWPLVLAEGVQDIWTTQPIGGELRPEIQSSVFDSPPVSPDDYATCVTTTHASWLINQTAFDPSFTGPKLTRALAGSGALGYDLRVTSARVSLSRDGSPAQLDLRVSNGGVAPFYYDWPIEVAVLDGNTVVQTWHPPWRLSTLLPGSVTELSTSMAVPQLSSGGPYTMGVRVLNPLAQGAALRFGDVEQEEVWLRLTP
jgi:hypothetical protein